ncbi:MAG: Do family serine endopeptidase [Deltaproteobacteria bacterium]|nr:Do family serine endopeptidase [Deltaproteobacteria bacterium]
MQQVSGNLGVLSDVAEAAVQSVVNISTTKLQRRAMSAEERMFRQFFGHRGDSDQSRGSSLGSGVVVSADGLVLTNNHVIDGAATIQVKLSDGREMAAKLVGADPRADLAVLRLEGKPTGLKAIALADSDKLRLGEVVLAIGSPFGLAQSVSMGIVSAKGRADVHIADFEDFIQTDAAINPGNSGGALVNLRGELVGINTAIASSSGGSQGIGFAIPTNMVQPILKSLLEKGRVVRGFLGVGLQALTADLRQSLGASGDGGVLITEVQPQSPADKAGLQRGDIVVELGGKQVDSPQRFRNAIAQAGAGSKVALVVQRQGKNQQLQAVLAEAPDPNAQQAAGPQAPGVRGLEVVPLTPALAQQHELPGDLRGLLIADVQQDSSAARAGLRPGDVILEVNRKAVVKGSDLADTLKENRPATLLIWREGRAAYVAVMP